MTRLTLGFAPRSSRNPKIGLRDGLRRYGREISNGGARTLILVFAASIVGVSALWSRVESSSELLITYLESPAPSDELELPDAMSAAQPAPPRVAVHLESLERQSAARRDPRPQIDALVGMQSALTHPKSSRTSSVIARRPMPLRPDGSTPSLPAVAAMGPNLSKSFPTPARQGRRSVRPLPSLVASRGVDSAEAASTVRGGFALPHPDLDSEPRTQRSQNPHGVPLDSLASCVSRDREEALKRRVVARLSGPRVCASADGNYRFIETKNLNAFLMSIDRIGDRDIGDRCRELSLALECLRDEVINKEDEKS